MHPECHYKCPCKRKTEGDFTDKGEESNVITDADAAQAGFENGGKGSHKGAGLL